MNSDQQSVSTNPEKPTNQRTQWPTGSVPPVHPLPIFEEATCRNERSSDLSPPVTPGPLKSQFRPKRHSDTKQPIGIPMPRPRNRIPEGMGWDHSRSSACGILGIGSMPSGSEYEAGYYGPFEESANRDIKSERMRGYIGRKIAQWEKKYPGSTRLRHAPPYIRGAPALLEHQLESEAPAPRHPASGSHIPPSDIPGPATLLPTAGLRPLPRIGIGNIDAHIAEVTGQPHVPSNRRPMRHTGAVAGMRGQGTAWLPNPSLLPPAPHTDAGYLGERGASVCASGDPVIPFDDKRTTVSGRKSNPHGAIGSPLLSGSDPQARGLLPTANRGMRI